MVTNFRLSSIFTPISASTFLGLPVVEKTQGHLYRGLCFKLQRQGGFGNWQTRPITMGADPGTCLSHTGQRNPPWLSFLGPAHCAPRSSAIFPPHLQKIPCFSLASTCQKHSRRNLKRSFTCAGTLSRHWGILLQWHPARGRWQRGGEGCGHWAAWRTAPSLSIPGVGPLWWLGEG